MKLCSHEGCGGKFYARGMCAKHYRKWIYATPNPPKKPKARELILKALPGTYEDLTRKTGLSKWSVMDWIRELRGAEIHVCDWRKRGKHRLMVFAKGAAPDVPCEIPRDAKAEVSKRYRERHGDEVRRRQRMHYTIKRATSKPNTWASALGARP